VRGDGSRPAAIVVDGCCLRERENLVRALDEDFDGGCAGPAAEFFVFAGEFVPVASFGCGRGELVGGIAWRMGLGQCEWMGGWTYCLGA
jgi:hypothetical protein